MLADRVPAIQRALAEAGLDGWLFACFQKNDPISLELLGLAQRQLVTRRCYYFVPRTGEPAKLVHRLEPAMLDHLPGATASYLTWREHRAALAALVGGAARIAAQYSPGAELPTVSRLDAGTAELLRGAGVELVSSADLVQRFADTWSPHQLAGHRRAAAHLHAIVHAAFDRVAAALAGGRAIDEYGVQRFILERFAAAGLATEADPIVGVNAHSADPHYVPEAAGSAPIARGDFLLIDLWAKETAEGSVYADITWCGVCAPAPTDRQGRSSPSSPPPATPPSTWSPGATPPCRSAASRWTTPPGG
jgi:Xaa-Pro aminopeptidase